MSIYFFFAISSLSIFSIHENLKGKNKISLIKGHLLLVLLIVTINSFALFINEFLFVDLEKYISILHLCITFLIYNIVYLLTIEKTKYLFIIEIILLLFILTMIFNGYRIIHPFNESLIRPSSGLIFFNLFFRAIGIILIIRNLYLKADNQSFKNAYTALLLKYKMHILIFAIIILMPFIVYALMLGGVKPEYKHLLIFMYSGIIIFSLYRPLIFDNCNFINNNSSKYVEFEKSKFDNKIESEFYINKYYLNPDAKINDLSSKIGVSNFEILEFVKMYQLTSFSDLVNKSRVDHLITLLNDQQYTAYTIEALSLMSGFSNRRTMYIYFKKFYNTTPTDYLNNLNR